MSSSEHRFVCEIFESCNIFLSVLPKLSTRVQCSFSGFIGGMGGADSREESGAVRLLLIFFTVGALDGASALLMKDLEERHLSDLTVKNLIMSLRLKSAGSRHRVLKLGVSLDDDDEGLEVGCHALVALEIPAYVRAELGHLPSRVV